MALKWIRYLNHIKHRMVIDRGFFKGAGVVTRLYAHFKWGKGRRSFPTHVKRPSIAFFPQPAGPWYNIWLVLQNTDFKITNDPEAADYVFIFDDSTQTDVLGDLPNAVKGKLINHRVRDVSKSHVNRVFEAVFGYRVAIDPTRFVGAAVEKSERNGTHDGRIIECPIPPDNVKAGYTYQKLVDSTFTGQTAEDLRILCVYGEIGAVFHKHKDLDQRFGMQYLSTDVREASEVFSKKECALISRFCDEMGLDFGAVDVMRDKHDGRIYIVDVNKTCMPVLSLPYAEQYRSLKMIAKVFEKRVPT